MTPPVSPAFSPAIQDIPVPVDVIIGEAKISMETLKALTPGEVVELMRGVTDEVDILVSGRLMARGHLVVQAGELGVTLSSIVDSRAAA